MPVAVGKVGPAWARPHRPNAPKCRRQRAFASQLGIPIRGTFADRSVPAIASALTQVMIDPTVRQATRISSRTAVLEQHTVNQATVSSKAYVGPAP